MAKDKKKKQDEAERVAHEQAGAADVHGGGRRARRLALDGDQQAGHDRIHADGLAALDELLGLALHAQLVGPRRVPVRDAGHALDAARGRALDAHGAGERPLQALRGAHGEREYDGPVGLGLHDRGKRVVGGDADGDVAGAEGVHGRSWSARAAGSAGWTPSAAAT